MGFFAKQSTVVSHVVGPILDSSGTEYASAVIGDLSISKNGGTLTALASAASLTYIANGFYTLALTTGNTDTLGTARVVVNKATYQMPALEVMVQPATVYDALFTNATTAAGGLGDIQRMAGTTLTARDIGASVLLSVGTGTGQVNLSSGKVPATLASTDVTGNVAADVQTIKTQTVTCSGGVTVPAATLASTTNITAGTITTVTTVTNQLTAAQIATGVWTDTTAGDFTTALSVGKSLMNGVSLGTGLTVAAVSGAVGSVTGAVGSVTGNVGGNVVGSVGSVTAAVTLSAADGAAVPNGTGTAAAGGATSITLQTALGADSLPVGCLVKITSGTGAGQERVITAYVNSTKVVTVGRAWVTNPDNTSVYAVTYNDMPKIDSSLKVSGVVLTDTVTTYTGNTPQTGDSYALIGATGSGLTSLAPASTALSTATWTSTLATNLGTLASHDPGATLGTSTLTQTQVTGGAYALNSSSFAFNAGLDLTSTQKTSVQVAVAAQAQTIATNVRDVSNAAPAAGSLGEAINNTPTNVWASGTRTLTSLSGLTVDTVTSVTDNVTAVLANNVSHGGNAATLTLGSNSGYALTVQSSAADYAGAFFGGGAGGDGLYALGGTGAHGIHAAGGAASGSTPAGHGVYGVGGGASTTIGGVAGAGVEGQGGTAALSTNTARGSGIVGIGQDGVLAHGDYNGLQCVGDANLGIAAAEIQYLTDKVDYKLSDLNANVSSRMATFALPANFADLAITVTTGRVTVGTNTDKTGYSLTQAFPTNFAALGITTGGHIQNVDTLTTYTGDTPQTGDAYARLGAPTLSSVSADIAALPTAAGNADALLGRNIAGGSNSGRLVREALYVLRNKVDVGAGHVYATDDTTIAWSFTVTSDPSADPVTVFDPS